MAERPGALIETHGSLLVVRDDVVPGGTKARVLPRFLEEVGAGEVCVYASPAYGYAQVALALACAATGREAVVFTAKRGQLHPLTAEAAAFGARVVQVPTGYLSNVQAKARGYCEATGATLLPFGFEDARFGALLEEHARWVLPQRLGQLWCTGGSGTLARALARARPEAELCVVQVGKQLELPGMRVYRAPERFQQAARRPPPWPSCANYDAKAWRFLEKEAAPGAVFWNVAG